MEEVEAAPEGEAEAHTPIALVSVLRPFDLRFADPQLEAEFQRDTVPGRRRVGQANFLMFPVMGLVTGAGLWFLVPDAIGRVLPAMVGMAAVGLPGAAMFRWGPPRWFEFANSLATVLGVGLVLLLVSLAGPTFGLASAVIVLFTAMLSGTTSFPRALGNITGAAAIYLALLPSVADIDRPTLLVHAVALVMAAVLATQRGRLYREIQRDGWFHRRLSDRLLDNVLPASIVLRLKTGEMSIADGHAGATVLFADLVGFTKLATTLDPAALVALLREVFGRFDELSAGAGVEKIKTIGDAYMAAAGVADGHVDHVARMARLALDMRDAFGALPATQRHGLSVRIGLHTGPVVAGVLGTRRLAYDLWGDVVNTASRMESHGEPGKIHVSEAVAAACQHAFRVEPRGRIPVKGKGDLATFWLERGQ